MPKLLLERFFIAKVNLMLDGTCTPKLIGLKCKGIMIQEQKLPGNSGIVGSPLSQSI